MQQQNKRLLFCSTDMKRFQSFEVSKSRSLKVSKFQTSKVPNSKFHTFKNDGTNICNMFEIRDAEISRIDIF